jgi:adenine deaminase
MMNYPGVAFCDESVHAKLEATRRAGKVIGGHYPSPDLGMDFSGYAAGGPSDDHEGTRVEDAVARVRQGMRAMLRYGSAWHDVAAQIRAVTEQHLDPRNFVLCTDDSHAATLVQEGHMDRVVRHAIAQGLAPMTAIQMATINTAEYFGLSKELGMIAPGRYADILVLPDLIQMQPDVVIARGQVVADTGRVIAEIPALDYPDWALQTVHLKRRLKPADFRLRTHAEGGVTAHVIAVIENQAPTRHLRLSVMAHKGEVKIDIQQDLAKVAVVERHRGSGGVQVGLVHGFGLRSPCGFATTVAHDCHQMIVIGTDESDMALAANRLAEIGGGQVAARRGKVIGEVALPVAGLVSNQRADVVAAQAQTILDAFRACGCPMNNPNMQMSLLALVVIPELRLSDRGLVDVNHFQVIDVLEG